MFSKLDSVCPPSPFFTWRQKQNQAAEMLLFYFTIQTTDKVQKNNFTYHNTLSSETFRLQLM
jgi:hypothetical protein